MYLGELTRHILLDVTNKGLLFNGDKEAAAILSQPEVFLTAHISTIESDPANDFSSTWSVLRELKLEKLATHFDCVLLKFICQCVSIRASMLAGAG